MTLLVMLLRSLNTEQKITISMQGDKNTVSGAQSTRNGFHKINHHSFLFAPPL
jgi:hypothetical protein